ncbi:IPT/TIG domain-containing protein [Bacteroides sp.]|uniref:IPT/TIG domain-containing protein n=1 Tax=Bacteroides sp. TaxID=29523 RepID=UPI0026160D83|nr:IPT/TIG domain-containing protein [Bacteroides sp.]MDD3036882.1 IPT/TIG domain-containing protein [Bacteroides sp.]
MDKHLLYTFVMCSMFLASCGSDEVTPGTWVTTPVDTSKPTEFTDFTPKEGGVRTRMYITGSNFGTDESKIHVTVGGQKAAVIASNGSKIHCMLPARAYDGDIKIIIDDKDGNKAVDYTFDQRFNYLSKMVVGTLLRNFNSQTGAAPFQDGLFSEGAGVPTSDWMMFDPKPENGDKIIFTCNYEGGSHGLRTINLTKKEVKTLYAGSRADKMQTFTFSTDGDTLLIADDNGQGDLGNVSMPNIHYLLRSEGFQKLRPYCYSSCTYAIAYMPDGTTFFTSWKTGAVMKLMRKGGVPFIDGSATTCFHFVTGGGQQIKLKAHPEGKYVYIFGRYNGAIYKSEYDPIAKDLKAPTLLVGQYDNYENAGLVKEGPGALARFGRPWGGNFVKNPKYVQEGRDDVYDFYLADQEGHCIWKITPEGVATIIAGRSNYTVDNSFTGYIDGDPLHEARFNGARAITYEEGEETFYIGDTGNHCVRYLRTE